VIEAERAFVLSLTQLRQISDELCEKIIEGLAKPRRQIKALPAYLARASKVGAGDVVVLDVGDTAMRVAWL
jgi:hexokinase